MKKNMYKRVFAGIAAVLTISFLTNVGDINSALTVDSNAAVIVNHNMDAINTLTQLSENQEQLSKSLAKLSSGMKINSAADDPSGYQISERMRVQIRALDQANYNAQNGRSMLKVAEGAVSSTVEILRGLKEKVINAVNDTNTEVDRDAIQKEIDASIQQIDDNALLTFNGKFLNDGSRTCKGEATKNVLYNEQLSQNTTTCTLLTELQDRNGKSLGIEDTDSVTVSFVYDGKTYTAEKTPMQFNPLCNVCGDYNYEDDSPYCKVCGAPKESLPGPTTLNSLFTQEFLCGSEVKKGTDVLTFSAGTEIGIDSASAYVYTHDNGNAVVLTAKEGGIDTQISAICIEVTDKYGNLKADANSVLNSFTEAIAARNKSENNSIPIQIGANANQIMNLSLDDMRASALGLSGKGQNISVGDKTAATAAIKVIDNALQKALNQEASIGAVMNRLEFTSNNLTTSSENLQSAESTYRDADMAKEMTEFTKNNILLQAATAMLAQANQQNQGVLSLLQ